MPKPKKQQKRKRALRLRLQDLVEEMVGKGIALPEAQAQLEKQFLAEVMRQCAGNQCRAAERLDVHRNTLRRKLQAHGLL
jgi:DNA-binding protein Fis